MLWLIEKDDKGQEVERYCMEVGAGYTMSIEGALGLLKLVKRFPNRFEFFEENVVDPAKDLKPSELRTTKQLMQHYETLHGDQGWDYSNLTFFATILKAAYTLHYKIPPRRINIPSETGSGGYNKAYGYPPSTWAFCQGVVDEYAKDPEATKKKYYRSNKAERLRRDRLTEPEPPVDKYASPRKGVSKATPLKKNKGTKKKPKGS